MHYLKYALFLTSAVLVTGCAELSAINTKVGEIAGQINQTLGISSSTTNNSSVGDNGIQMVKNEFQVNQNVDDVFLKIRREFGFAPTSQGASTVNEQWSTDKARIFETVPGQYYRMNGKFGSDMKRKYGYSEIAIENSLDVTIERAGKNKTSVQYDVRGSQNWLKEAETRLKRAVK
ncbi:hemophilus-specific protein [Caviibacterium pharyngocola]|uniref:Hemophilus-specific protein n=1 Tax=Caviibacterium pharyngocola TaxID=28159 RepID=A0A2M8RV60_9PAST|nr:hemophilus-specific protein [Caviibacterium pharyngocola]PJG82763.1 hemophilus-specific protein [Caviibacterium pharyngocola]